MDPVKLICALFDSRQRILRVTADVDGTRKFVEADIPTKAYLLPYVLTSVFDNQNFRKVETPIEKTIEFVRDSLKAHPLGKTKPFAKRSKKDQRRAVLQAWSVAGWNQGERDGLRFTLHGSGDPCGEEIDRGVCQLLFREAGDNLWLGETPQFSVYLEEPHFWEHAKRPSREMAMKQLTRSIRSAFPSTSRFVSFSTNEKLGRPDFEINRVTYPLKVLESTLSKGQGESDQIARLRDQHSTSSSSLLDKALTRWLEGQSRILILSGSPGTGKTWSLAIAANRFLDYYQCDSDNPITLFPFCARVADIAQYLDPSRTDASTSLQEAILRVFEARVGFDCSDQGLAGVTSDLAHELIHSGRIMLLLDAWDECSATLEPVVFRALKGFLNDPDQQASRIILSSRPADQLRHDFSSATVVEILPLENTSDAEIAKFVKVWFGNNELKFKEALPHFLGTTTTKDLFKTPLFAAILLRLYESEGVVPSAHNRSDLLCKLILSALKRAARDPRDHSARIHSAQAPDLAHDILTVLAKLAYETFDGQSWSITSSQFTDALKAEPALSVLGGVPAVLDALTGRFGIFSRSLVDGSLSVIHQSLAEFLAAHHVATVYGKEPASIRKWMREQVGVRLLDSRWHEFLWHLSALSQHPQAIVEELLRWQDARDSTDQWPRGDVRDSALCLAGHCIAAIGGERVDQRVYARVTSTLICKAIGIRSYRQTQYFSALASIGITGNTKVLSELTAQFAQMDPDCKGRNVYRVAETLDKLGQKGVDTIECILLNCHLTCSELSCLVDVLVKHHPNPPLLSWLQHSYSSRELLHLIENYPSQHITHALKEHPDEKLRNLARIQSETRSAGDCEMRLIEDSIRRAHLLEAASLIVAFDSGRDLCGFEYLEGGLRSILDPDERNRFIAHLISVIADSEGNTGETRIRAIHVLKVIKCFDGKIEAALHDCLKDACEAVRVEAALAMATLSCRAEWAMKHLSAQLGDVENHVLSPLLGQPAFLSEEEIDILLKAAQSNADGNALEYVVWVLGEGWCLDEHVARKHIELLRVCCLTFEWSHARDRAVEALLELDSERDWIRKELIKEIDEWIRQERLEELIDKVKPEPATLALKKAREGAASAVGHLKKAGIYAPDDTSLLVQAAGMAFDPWFRMQIIEALGSITDLSKIDLSWLISVLMNYTGQDASEEAWGSIISLLDRFNALIFEVQPGKANSGVNLDQNARKSTKDAPRVSPQYTCIRNIHRPMALPAPLLECP